MSIGEIITLNINQIKKIQDYHQQGIVIRKIAKKMHIDKNTVWKYLHYEEYQKKYATKKSTDNKLEKNPIDPGHTGEIVTANYPPVDTPSQYPQRQRDVSFPQEASSAYEHQKQENQDYWTKSSEMQKKIQEINEKIRKQELSEAAHRQQEKEKNVSDILDKFDARKTQNDREQRMRNDEFFKTMTEKINKQLETQSNQTQEINNLIRDIPRLVRDGLEKRKKLEYKKEETDNKIDQKDLYPTPPENNEQEQKPEQEQYNLDILLPVVIGGVDLTLKLYRFYCSPQSVLPINSPEYWSQLSKLFRKNQ
jgi:hypothetical protein